MFFNYLSFELTPIFVTFDRRISTLHSLLNTRIIFEGNESNNPELVELNFLRKLIWTNNDLEKMKELTINDLNHRFVKATSQPKDLTLLISKIEKLENEVLSLNFD